MGTEDVQARASVFCTEERHARVEVELVRFATLVAQHQRITRELVQFAQRTALGNLVFASAIAGLAMACAVTGAVGTGVLCLASAGLIAYLRVLALRRIAELMLDVVSWDLPYARCSHVDDLIESFVHGMDGNVERSPAGGMLVSKGLGVDPGRKSK